MNRPQQTDITGFSLLELILVIFLITLILGLSSLFFARTLPSHRIEANAREIAATVRHARASAQMEAERKTVLFNLDTGHYGIQGKRERTVSPGVSIRIVDPYSGDVAAGPYQIVAHPSGRVDGGTIVLSGAGKTISIQADPVIGSVIIR